MPKFSPDHTGSVRSTFGFSAVELTNLGAAEYTLVGIVVDRSGSVDGFYRAEEAAIKSIVEACRKSPRGDNLLLRYTTFDSSLAEVHGFKLLQDCNADDYTNTIAPGGMTALYDATIDGIDALARYGRELHDNHFGANAILFVITDGANNTGTHRSAADVATAMKQSRQQENLESVRSVLIGVNVDDPIIAKELAEFNRAGGFDQYVEIKNANAKTLAKLADFVSKSISAQSQALGTGGASQALVF